MEIGGKDIRARPLEKRKARLEKLVPPSNPIVYSEHVDRDGDGIFAAACKTGLEGIISKRRDRPYVSGPCKHWVKVKNPNAPWAKQLAL